MRRTPRCSCSARLRLPRGTLKGITQCDKLNIAALGNQVSQLHVHVIARRHSDAAWPKPVWGVKPPSAYSDTQQARLLGSLRQSLEASGLCDMNH